MAHGKDNVENRGTHPGWKRDGNWEEVAKNIPDLTDTELDTKDPERILGKLLQLLDPILSKHVGKAPRKQTQHKKFFTSPKLKELRGHLKFIQKNNSKRQRRMVPALRQAIKELRTDIRKEVAKQKEHHEQNEILKASQDWITNPREAWKVLKRLKGDANSKREMILKDAAGRTTRGPAALQTMADYLKTLMNKDNADDIPSAPIPERGTRTHDVDTYMEAQFSKEELTLVLKNLKQKTSAADDNLTSIIIKKSGEKLHDWILLLMNTMWTSRSRPKDFNLALISAIYKKGDRRDPKNYRPISVLSVLDKIYASLLRLRLIKWMDDNDLLPAECGGSRKGMSPVEQMFNLHELICRAGGPIHAAFMDVSKAFDSVWRNALWAKLRAHGVKGKLLDAIRSLYKCTNSVVHDGQYRSKPFNTNTGLRQGCPLSPLLYMIYTADLINLLKEKIQGIRIFGMTTEENISALLYADDMVILTRTKAELEAALEVLAEYEDSWRIRFNPDKSKVVVFNYERTPQNRPRKTPFHLYQGPGTCTGTATCKCHYQMGHTWIKRLSSYKYLGLIWHQSLTWDLTMEDRLSHARHKAGMVRMMGIDKGLSPKIASTLVDAMVRPTLLYAAELWAPPKWKDADVLLKGLGRHILGAPRGFPSEPTWGELGWWTSGGTIALATLRFYKRLQDSRNMITQRMARITRTTPGPTWFSRARAFTASVMDCTIGMADGVMASTSKGALKGLVHTWQENRWLHRMRSGSTTTDYRTLKSSLSMEPYLKDHHAYPGRIYITQLRAGYLDFESPPLPRWLQISEYKCRLCGRHSPPQHLLTSCPGTEMIRASFYFDTSLKLNPSTNIHALVALTPYPDSSISMALGNLLSRIGRIYRSA